MQPCSLGSVHPKDQTKVEVICITVIIASLHKACKPVKCRELERKYDIKKAMLNSFKDYIETFM